MSKVKRDNKPKRRRYQQVIDGEKLIYNTDATHLEQCCDCGLVHRLKYKVIDGKTIEIRVWRDDKETKRVRKRNAKIKT